MSQGEETEDFGRMSDFAALLCSRMAHDLVSPAGAIGNGLELLEEDPDPELIGEVNALLAGSLESLHARLQFFRLAFGAASGLGDRVDPVLAERTLRRLLATMRLDLDWRLPGEPMSKHQVKLVLNLSLVASECLVRGGTVRILGEDGQETASGSALVPFRIEAEGTRVMMPQDVRDFLESPRLEGDLPPRAAPAVLACLLARELGARVALEAFDPNPPAVPKDGGMARIVLALHGPTAKDHQG